MKVLKGTVVAAPALEELAIYERGALLLDDAGKILAVERTAPDGLDAEVIDYGDKLILQSFADLHLHGPQYPMLGMGMDLPLFISDLFTAFSIPEQHGTSIRTTVMLLISFVAIISLSLSV